MQSPQGDRNCRQRRNGQARGRTWEQERGQTINARRGDLRITNRCIQETRRQSQPGHQVDLTKRLKRTAPNALGSRHAISPKKGPHKGSLKLETEYYDSGPSLTRRHSQRQAEKSARPRPSGFAAPRPRSTPRSTDHETEAFHHKSRRFERSCKNRSAAAGSSP